MGSEVVSGDEFIFQTLSGDAELGALIPGGVHSEVAPEGTASPWIVFQYLGGSDLRGVGTVRVYASGVWIVKVIGEGQSFADLAEAADRMDTVLHGSFGGVVVACYREQPFRFAEVDGDRQYRHLGGNYRLLVQ